MEKRIQAKARVQLTVEVEESMWGLDCSIGQLYKQAAEGGVAKVRKIISDANAHSKATIIGEPKVVGIITEES